MNIIRGFQPWKPSLENLRDGVWFQVLECRFLSPSPSKFIRIFSPFLLFPSQYSSKYPSNPTPPRPYGHQWFQQIQDPGADRKQPTKLLSYMYVKDPCPNCNFWKKIWRYDKETLIDSNLCTNLSTQLYCTFWAHLLASESRSAVWFWKCGFSWK